MAARDVQAMLERIAAAAERQDRAALTRLIAAYGRLYQRLEPRVKAIAQQALADKLSAAQVRRLSDFGALERAAASELRDFTGLLVAELSAGAGAAAALGNRHGQALLLAALAGGPAPKSPIRALPASALQVITDFVREGQPLRKRIEMLAPFSAQKVANGLIEAIAKGYNPIKTASAVQDVFGNGLTDALRMTRTAQLYSYREATRQNYEYNGAQGWQWYANIDDKTCLSCIAMHGSIHGNDETLNDHHNGRCVMIPIVEGRRFVDRTGEEYFNSLSPEQQEATMGKGMFAAWSDGKFEFGALSKEKPDAVYGPMRTAASLKELVGDE